MCSPPSAQFVSVRCRQIVTAMIGSRGTQTGHAPHPIPFIGRMCCILCMDLMSAYSLPTPLPVPGLWYPCGNARFELLRGCSGVSGFEPGALGFLGKLITCITGGSRKRTMGARCAISAQRSKLLGYRGAHGKRRLDPFNERPLHELLFGKHTGRLYLY